MRSRSVYILICTLLFMLLSFKQGGAGRPEVGKPVLTEARGTRIIRFGGHRWSVKHGKGLAPANNNWSDDPRSVWIGTDGKLHLEIRKQDNTWYSSQIISSDFAQYGLHRFYLESPVNALSANVVLGLFLYANDRNEIDIEFKREGGSDNNAQYVIQPYTISGNRYAFVLDYDGPTIHEIDWQPDYITFRTLAGDDPTTAKLLQEWHFEQPGIPSEAKQLRIEMNLWLLNPAMQTEPVEVIISDLETPHCSNLSPPPASN